MWQGRSGARQHVSQRVDQLVRARGESVGYIGSGKISLATASVTGRLPVGCLRCVTPLIVCTGHGQLMLSRVSYFCNTAMMSSRQG